MKCNCGFFKTNKNGSRPYTLWIPEILWFGHVQVADNMRTCVTAWHVKRLWTAIRPKISTDKHSTQHGLNICFLNWKVSYGKLLVVYCGCLIQKEWIVFEMESFSSQVRKDILNIITLQQNIKRELLFCIRSRIVVIFLEIRRPVNKVSNIKQAWYSYKPVKFTIYVYLFIYWFIFLYSQLHTKQSTG